MNTEAVVAIVRTVVVCFAVVWAVQFGSEQWRAWRTADPEKYTPSTANPGQVTRMQSINIMNESSVELWHVRDQTIDCLLAVHIYPRPGSSPARVEIGCGR